MRALVVVKANPVTYDPAGMLHALEAVSMHTLLLERSDFALDHAVLLRAVRGDELLAQPVAPHQGRVMATGEHQAIVGPQQEWLGHCPQCSEPGDEGLFQSAGGRSGSPCARQVPAQQLSRMAVDDQGQRRPAVSPSPDTAQVCRPALVGRLSHRWQSLHARPHANRPLAYLPAPDLGDALHGVLIELQRVVFGAGSLDKLASEIDAFKGPTRAGPMHAWAEGSG